MSIVVCFVNDRYTNRHLFVTFTAGGLILAFDVEDDDDDTYE
jgi:hypothetical protein